MDFSVESHVSKVVVYPDRARVTSDGRCELPTGRHQITFEELPLYLEEDSVRASGHGSARVRLLGVDVQRRYYAETPAARAQEVEKALQDRREALRVVEDGRENRLALARHLEGLGQATAEYARGLSRGRTTVEDQARLVQFLQEQDEQLRAELRELDEQQRMVKREIERLEQELKQLGSARPRQRFRAILDVEVTEAGDFEAEVSYVVGRAGWQPLYDIRLVERTNENGRAGHALTLSYLAQITQDTGQEWENIRLTVSTARPALNQRLPELKPWFIDELKVQPRPRAVPMRAMAAPMAMKAADQEGEAMLEMAAYAPVEADVAVAEAQDSGTAVSFTISGSVDIPGDGAPHKTTIAQFDLDPQLDYLAIPRHTDAVYRRAKVNHPGPGPLLAGPAALFAGDEFIGRNTLEYTAAGEEIELLLGAEERIDVERELMLREVDKRLLRDVRQLRYGYEIRLKNLLSVPAQVTVEDQYPVSRHEQIKVKLEKTGPAPAKHSDLGILEWRMALAPDEKQTIQLEYSIEHPRSLQVSGLIE
jgi:uncharacterized protein (TIGR02231 family)